MPDLRLPAQERPPCRAAYRGHRETERVPSTASQTSTGQAHTSPPHGLGALRRVRSKKESPQRDGSNADGLAPED